MAAAFDRRRIQAPEDSHPPLFVGAETGPSKRDGRAADALRPVFIKTGLVTQANGSAYIEAAGVKIACSAFGPRPKPPPYSPQGTLNVEVKFAPFASRVRRAPLRDTEPVNLSTLLAQLLLPALRLHLLPKLSVDVHVLVLEADTEAAVLSAVGTVVTCAGDELLLDPTGPEASQGECTVTLGALPALGKISNVHLVGEAELGNAIDMVQLGLAGAQTMHTALAQAVAEGRQS